MLLLLGLLLLLPAIIFLVATKPRRAPRRPPGPRGLPFIGNLHQFDISKPHVWLAKLSNKHGPIMSLKFCRAPMIVLSSPQVAKIALKDDETPFLGRPYSSAWSRLSYGNCDIIGAPYTDYWRHMRKMVVLHLLSPQKTRSFRLVRRDEVSRMLAEVSKRAGQIIDVELMAMSFTCNLLCRVAFGKKFDDASLSWRLFGKIMKQFLASVTETFVFDKLLFGWISRACGAAGRVEKVFEEMDSFYQQLIDDHRSRRGSSSDRAIDEDDIIDLLIRFKEDESAPFKIDWNQIKALLMNVFIGGTDTTGISITWVLTALIKNPNAMKKVQDEIRNVVGMKSFVDEEDIKKLPYFKAVIKETLRLYPPIPLLIKETTATSIINGYEIEPKTLAIVNLWAVCRDPEYWENPGKFLPERFLNTSVDYLGNDFEFIPFGSGKRMCPGMHLAVATIELALANLLYKFNWELPHGMAEQDVDTLSSIGIIMRKKNPLCLIAKTFI